MRPQEKKIKPGGRKINKRNVDRVSIYIPPLILLFDLFLFKSIGNAIAIAIWCGVLFADSFGI